MDRQTLGEDFSYKEEILTKHPTVFFRPGDRTSPEQPVYVHSNEQGMTYLGLITQYGNHEKQIPPIHEEPRIRMRIISRVAKTINEISVVEFTGAYLEIHDLTSLISWLEDKYPAHTFGNDSVITLYRIEYV